MYSIILTTHKSREMSLQEIFELHGIAVELMIADRCKEAATRLVLGIAALNEYQQKQADVQYETPSLEACSNNNHARATPMTPSLLLRHYVLPESRRPLSMPAVAVPSPGNNPLAFYPIVFFLNPAMSLWCSHHHEILQDMLAAVMVYNLAVYHHRAGICNGRDQQMKHALKLYSTARCLVKHRAQEFEPAAILSAISGANMAHIHAEFFDSLAIERYAKQVRALAQIIDNASEIEDFLNDFWVQTSMCQGVLLRLAPAA